MSISDRPITAAAIDALLLDSSPYLSCDECFEQIDAYVEQSLDDPEYEDARMRVHLQACGACAEGAATLTELLGQS